jgi:hypothetical protein
VLLYISVKIAHHAHGELARRHPVFRAYSSRTDGKFIGDAAFLQLRPKQILRHWASTSIAGANKNHTPFHHSNSVAHYPELNFFSKYKKQLNLFFRKCKKNQLMQYFNLQIACVDFIQVWEIWAQMSSNHGHG